LLAGKAYPCVCTPQDLDTKRQLAQKEKRKASYDGTCRPPEGVLLPLPEDKPYTIRFRSPHVGTTVVEDLVKGDVIFDNRELDDLIIARTDGTPTYNFCVVIDDIEMNISHIIRGDDHLANTPRQIQLYHALGHRLPQFAHVPLILGTDKSRLSKRHGATSVTAYRDMGYLPEAVVNYLVRLGWSHGDDEIFSSEELIEKFSLESVGKSAGVFNPEKFLWLNSHYLKSRPLKQLATEIIPFIEAKGYPVPKETDWLEKMIATLKERAKTLTELVDQAHYYLSDDISIDEKAWKKFFTADIVEPLTSLIQELGKLADFSESTVQQGFAKVLEQTGLSMGKLAQPVRLALTGSTVSPGIHEVIAVLGKERTLKRLNAALQPLISYNS
jgi:glutamyl-tRNA synthetase